jgi:hypothetical protein
MEDHERNIRGRVRTTPPPWQVHLELDGQRGVDAPRGQPVEQLHIFPERRPAAHAQRGVVARDLKADATARVVEDVLQQPELSTGCNNTDMNLYVVY